MAGLVGGLDCALDCLDCAVLDCGSFSWFGLVVVWCCFVFFAWCGCCCLLWCGLTFLCGFAFACG